MGIWRDYISRLAWEHLGVLSKELEETAGKREVWFQAQINAEDCLRKGIQCKTWCWWKLGYYWSQENRRVCLLAEGKKEQPLGIGQDIFPDDWATMANVNMETGRRVLSVTFCRKVDRET